MTANKNDRDDPSGDRIEISIGDNASRVAAGKNVQQSIDERKMSIKVDPADLMALREIFTQLRQQVEIEAPPGVLPAALERVGELEAAIADPKPDIPTIEYVKNWFTKNLPQLAGSIVSVLVNPIVGKVVEAAGEIAAQEFKKRLGLP